jgi:hypothetical protein
MPAKLIVRFAQELLQIFAVHEAKQAGPGNVCRWDDACFT